MPNPSAHGGMDDELGQTVFAQLMDFVPAYEFRGYVARYGGEYHMRSWDQFLSMAFAHLTYRASLRDSTR